VRRACRLDIIAKLATVLECEPAELVRVPSTADQLLPGLHLAAAEHPAAQRRRFALQSAGSQKAQIDIPRYYRRITPRLARDARPSDTALSR
jgi:hypothetical protein